MKVIIAGSRGINDINIIRRAVSDSGFEITEVVSGGAAGVDMQGERWANENSVPVKRFMPDWKQNGKSAGVLRNIQMAKYADALIAVWNGTSRGTGHMIEIANHRYLKIHVHRV